MKRTIKLPYKLNALEPIISQETLDFHYNKHHKGYEEKLEELLKDSPLKNKKLEEIIKNSSGSIYNNAAQVWNHNFYWQSLSPEKSTPSKKLLALIEKQHGTLADFEKKIVDAGVKHFGSGYLWILMDKKGLKIKTTKNAWCPIDHGVKPLLTIDLWEHSYYIDYRNKKKDHLEKIMSLLNWDFAARQMK